MGSSAVVLVGGLGERVAGLDARVVFLGSRFWDVFV